MRRFAIIGLIAGVQLASALAALGQAIGPNGVPMGPLAPPINPQQVFHSQPQPQTTAPSATVMPPVAPLSTPPTVGSSVPLSSAPTATVEFRARLVRCRHEAAKKGVSRHKRAAYVRRCTRHARR